MRLALAASILLASVPAAAQTTDRSSVEPQTTDRLPARTGTPGKQSARTAYGYRLTAPDDDDYDPTDRRVLRRLNTRVNNRLETRIERYRFVDMRSDRTQMKSRNRYSTVDEPANGQGLLRRRSPDDR